MESGLRDEEIKARHVKPKATHYYCEMFRQSFLFCIGWSGKDYELYMQKRFNCRGGSRGRDGVTAFLHFTDGSSVVVVWLRKKRDYNSLAHEAVHAANFTLKQKGVKASFRNDEAQAYLVGLLVEKALG
jgi:hypothetical protein